MDEQGKIESYRALYRVRPLIYHVGDVRLWMPIRQDGVVLWLVYVVVFFVFCYVLPVLAWALPFDRAITMAVGPIAAAYYTVKLDPAGKTVPRYLRDILHFLIRPKWVVRWQTVRQPGGTNKVHFSGYCRPYERMSLPHAGEEWRGRAGGAVQGMVEGLRLLLLPASVRVRWKAKTGKLSLQPLQRPSKRGWAPPAWLETDERKTLTGTTASPLQLERQKGEKRKVYWQVSERTDRSK